MLSIMLAAGHGQRFRDAGYTTPKPLLPMHDGRPLLAWVRERLLPGRQCIVARAADRAALLPYISGMAAVWLDDSSDGPLASARAAESHIAPDGELLVTYCDTWLPGGVGPFADAARRARAATAMIVFPSSDPRYGYWDGRRVVEKQVISPWAVSGLFYFRHGRTCVERMRAHAAPGAGLPALMDAATFCYEASVVDVGTPAEYEEALHAYAQPV